MKVQEQCLRCVFQAAQTELLMLNLEYLKAPSDLSSIVRTEAPKSYRFGDLEEEPQSGP